MNEFGVHQATISKLRKRRACVRLYLAGMFSRQKEFREYRKQLDSIKIQVTSSWLFEEDSDDDCKKYKSFSKNDKRDIRESDVFVLFSSKPYNGQIEYYSNEYDGDCVKEQSLESLARGGRHHEAGYAEALDKMCNIVGPRENIFHYDNSIWQHWDTWSELFEFLKQLQLARSL